MSYAKQATYNTIGNLVTLGAQWLIIMLIPKITDFTEAGVFAIAVSVASIVNQISTYNHQYQISNQYHDFSENDFAVSRIVLIVLSLALIVPISLLFGYGWYQIEIIVAYSVYRSIINYAFFHMASLQIMGHLDYSGKCMMAEGIVSFTVFMGSYAAAGNLLLSLSLMALTGGGMFLLLMSSGYSRYRGKAFRVDLTHSENVKELIVVSSPLFISAIVPILLTALPKMILENYYGQEIVGIFNTLASPTTLIPTLAISVFTPLIVYFADICRRGDMRLLRIKFTRLLLLMALLCVAAYTVSYLLAEPVFVLIYGQGIQEYVYLFNIMIVGVFLYSIGALGITVMTTKNQKRAAGVTTTAVFLISLAIFMILIPRYGIDGATWSLLVSYAVFAAAVSAAVYLIPLPPVLK